MGEQSWQVKLFQKLSQEAKANEDLKRTDLEAYKAKMEAMLPENTCCFCRETFRGFGNSPSPVLEDGRACDTCNRSYSGTTDMAEAHVSKPAQ